MKKVERTVYEAEDGKVFETQSACEKYEAEIAANAKRTSYWRVTSGPDLTEGRGHYNCTFLEVYGPEWGQQELVEDWCYRTHGRPVAFVQGVSPMRNWYVGKLTREQFIEQQPQGQVGDTKKAGKRLRLVLASSEKGLVEEPAS